MRQACILAIALLAASCGGADSHPTFEVQLPSSILASPRTGGDFGSAVVLLDEMVAVGAPGDGRGGLVHLFRRGSGKLVRTLESPRAARNGRFGASLAADSGLIWIGAPGEGRVYAFDAAGGAARGEIGPEPGSFGAALAVAGGTLYVGAPSRDRATGMVVKYSLPARTEIGRMVSPAPQDLGSFGAALAASNNRVLVGAPGEARAYLLDGAGYPFGTFSGGDGFGRAVALQDDVALVGASGGATLYTGTTRTREIGTPPGARTFAVAVALDGPHALIAGADADGARVYVYSRTNGTPAVSVAPAPSAPGGLALATRDGVALVGVFQRAAGSSLAQAFDCGSGTFVQQ
jgi:hypothetical protein